MTLPLVIAGQQNTGLIPSKTYEFDQINNRINRNKIDKIPAIKQFISKTLQTLRYADLIYSFYYGSEVERLIGTQPSFATTEFPRFIREALIYDNRITGVVEFTITIDGSKLIASFLVQSIYGVIEEALILNL